MAIKPVIVFFVTDEERTAAKKLMPDATATDSFLIGELDDDQFDTLRRQGLVVEDRSRTEAPATARAGFEFEELGGGPRIASAEPMAAEPTIIDLEKPNYYLVKLNGPMLEEWRNALSSLKARPLEALPKNVYRMKLSPQQARSVQQLPFVAEMRVFGEQDTGTRRGPRIAAAGDDFGVTTGIAMRTYDVLLHGAQELENVLHWLEEHHVNMAGVGRSKVRIYLLENSSLLQELNALSGVMKVEEYVPPRLYNDHARVLLGVDSRISQQVKTVLKQTGKGQIVAVADTGFDQTHDDVPPQRVVGVVALGRKGDSTDPDGHGTHVAGSILGDGTASKGAIRGIAPEAKLFFQSVLDSDGGLGGLPLELQDLFKQAYEAGARIHNNSWGARTRGVYTANAVEVDDFVAHNRDMLIVIAAGNEATAAQPKKAQKGFVDWVSMSSPATAKNALTVGASRSDRSTGAYGMFTYGTAWPAEFPDPPISTCKVSGDPEAIAGFSSRGPCNDYRIKPDVVAPGTDIASMKSTLAPLSHFWGPVANQPKYAFDGGTSMATPLVAGCAALVRQYYCDQQHEPSAALLKATLINSARCLTAADAIADNNGLPNYHQGFGRVDLQKAIPNGQDPDLVLQFFDNWRDHSSALVRTGQRIQFSFSIQGGYPLRLCMVYTDVAARSLQNDLNLVLVHLPTNKKWLGNENVPMSLGIPDPTNNVEVIRIENPDPGEYLVQVSAANLLQTDPGQDFALVVTAKELSTLTKKG